MVSFFFRRLLHAIAVMVIAVTLGFSLVHLAPGDAMTGYVTQAGRTAEARDRMRANAGLNLPLSTQYTRFVRGALRGDLGRSFTDGQPVVTVLWTALRRSLVLAGAGLIAAIALGLLVGSAQGWCPQQRAFQWIGGALTALYAVPEFVLAIALLGTLAYGTGWFPVGGMNDPITSLLGSAAERYADALRHVFLPALTLALGWSAAVARQQRAAIADSSSADFVRTARAKGRSEFAALIHHALPTTVAPVLAVIGLMIPALVGGSVIVEIVFAWPGLGAQVVHAVAARDVPVVSGAIIVIALLVAISSLLIDMAIRVVDPRQRTVRSHES
jgi:peptide/nickel transport system permease protein